ncbi:hypothetical protein lacNasYZ03_18160 [Lactobacillus nasalidis]|uniref:Uncharacterized protein n=1 Tax=Lactobacillus nasalidis TaxID=2797258 RepID=A0ABQ3W9V8_9LACO|nr:hypothetical protein lacNasYZ01_12400 [Lactobacillus nasalidis]GHV99697.1 hypothetical protein lacNasYZ02_11270 [Lactobacillus nasalidis]GHW02129.1 hypothetical protein lacNasYZ03_18160 [Lactobacillus nasalidis]
MMSYFFLDLEEIVYLYCIKVLETYLRLDTSYAKTQASSIEMNPCSIHIGRNTIPLILIYRCNS